MPESLTALGLRLRHLRERRGLSAYEVSKAAGLGENHARAIELGQWRPRLATIIKIAKVLGADDAETARLAALAGVPPGGLPADKQARQSHWTALCWLLVNHVLIPLGALTHAAARLKGRGREVLLSAAEAAGDAMGYHRQFAPGFGEQGEREILDWLDKPRGDRGASYYEEFGRPSPPPRSIARLIEERLGAATAPSVTALERLLFVPGRPLDPRAFIVPVLADVYGAEAIHQVWTCHLDRSFAVRYFPVLYWHANRFQPFPFVYLPYGRLGESGQRALHEAIRGGLALPDLDDALLGRGNFPMPAERRRPIADVDGKGVCRLSLPYEDRGTSYYDYDADAPLPHDHLFDHLDRAEFIGRYPLAWIDRAGVEAIAADADLASWQAWIETLGKHVSPDVLDAMSRRVVAPQGWSPMSPLAVEGNNLGSLGTRSILSDALRKAAEIKMLGNAWSKIADAAAILDAPEAVTRFAESLNRGTP